MNGEEHEDRQMEDYMDYLRDEEENLLRKEIEKLALRKNLTPEDLNKTVIPTQKEVYLLHELVRRGERIEEFPEELIKREFLDIKNSLGQNVIEVAALNGGPGGAEEILKWEDLLGNENQGPSPLERIILNGSGDGIDWSKFEVEEVEPHLETILRGVKKRKSVNNEKIPVTLVELIEKSWEYRKKKALKKELGVEM